MDLLQVLIVDDEPVAREGLQLHLQAIAGVEVVGECPDARTAVAAIEALRPDVVLLDVQMPGADGFEVIRQVGAERMPAVVFVTAYDTYAVQAFESEAVDYLLKPVRRERLEAALRRARQRSADQQPALLRRVTELLENLHAQARPRVDRAGDGAGPYLDRILVRKNERFFFVRLAEVDWIGAAGNYVALHVGHSEHLVRGTIGALEARLDPEQFVRIHRSTIVNLDRIRELQPWLGGDSIVFLKDGTELKLSRRYQQLFEGRML